jgi:exopolysaccharide biosynthesis polyprenyl glycosylphosphotransferase
MRAVLSRPEVHVVSAARAEPRAERVRAADAIPDTVDEDPRYLACKRAFDVVFALVALLVTAPLGALVALLVRLESRGPVIFRQARCGRHGRVFACLKFRTMVEDAELSKEQLLALNEADGPVFKIRDDPRVTRVGAWLRRTSIDEIPQFWNVLRGDLSIVGPRPPLPEEVARYRPGDHRRLAVQPGITCLWQVCGRSEIGFDRWMALDLEYIRRRSFWLDLAIVARTVPAVLTGRGAA